MNFGYALEALKNGESVVREGWNGKHMHIYLEPSLRDIDGNLLEPCIVMFTAQGKRQPGWLASQADMLEEDWLVV